MQLLSHSTFLIVALLCCAVAGQWTVVNPTSTSAYLNNGGYSGLYRWYDLTTAPLPNRDTYYRYHWRELEPTQDNYDFSAIDAELTAAQNTYRGKFGFRIMVVDSWAGGTQVPNYFATSANGWTCTALQNTWVPNWNSAALLDRLTKLVDALSTRYKNDARLGWIDVGLYGDYGEWHNAELINAGCFPGPNGWGAATLQRKKDFINLVTSRFPNNVIVLNTNDLEGLCIALSGTRLGIRGDMLSDVSWTSQASSGDPLFALYRRQYRAAPFISEFSSNPDFTFLQQQVLEEHRANAGNGNFADWSVQTTAQKNAFLAAAPYIGPRLRLTVANYSTTVAPGGCFTVSLTFINDGSSRTYDLWNTVIQLRNPSTNAVAWQSTSVTDIRNVLPSNDGVASWTGSNSFTIPSTLAIGVYTVTIAVVDPTNYRPNFYLAIANPNSDISYNLGSINVYPCAPPPATCTTTTPTYTQPKYAIASGVSSWNDHPVGPLYTDFLMYGWAEAPNGAVGNVANTSPIWGSSGKSISFTTQRAWGIWGIYHACGIDRTGYNYVHFRMRAASSTSGNVFFYPFASPWNNPPSVDLSSYGGNPNPNSWTSYNIPLSAFPGLPQIFDNFVFGGNNNGATFYIDDFSLTDSTIA